MMAAQEAHDFYADPAHLAVTGSGRKRSRPAKSRMVPVRFDPAVISKVETLAADSGVTVSSWIRRAVERELERSARKRPVSLIPGPGHAGTPKALPSTLTVAVSAGSARCQHLSIANVTAAACSECGPLTVVKATVIA